MAKGKKPDDGGEGPAPESQTGPGVEKADAAQSPGSDDNGKSEQQPYVLETQSSETARDTPSENGTKSNGAEPDAEKPDTGPDTGPDNAPTPEVEPPETATAVQPAPVIERRGGFGSAFLGGILAAVLGFLAGQAGWLDPILPEAWTRDSGAKIAELEQKLSDQTSQIASLRDLINGIEIPDVQAVENRLSARIDGLETELKGVADLSQSLSGLATDLSDLDNRLTEVEKRPISQGVSQSAIDAYERELAALQQAVATERSEVEDLIAEAQSMEEQALALKADAAAAAQLAANRTELARLRAAIDAGAPFAPHVSALRDGGVSVPEDLERLASEGVATHASLKDDFPDAARKALAAAREAHAGDKPGIGAFLARQFGARSVEPREGDDPDAILSRVDAAVTQGDLATALQELTSLPEPARNALSAWETRAADRLAAIRAADELANRLNEN